MRLPEQKLWDRFRRNVAPDILLKRIENLIDVGWPDVMSLVCSPRGHGNVTFIELKAAAMPKRPTTRVLGPRGLSIAQQNWFIQHKKNCGRGFILIGVDSLHYLLDQDHAAAVNEYNIGQLAAHACARDWASISERLRGQ
jgi:hypothetical protein